jgi:hypothetical protein
VTEFRLVPLSCPSCGSSVEAEATDTVFYCVSCRSGYLFVGEGAAQRAVGDGVVTPVAGALAPLEVSFLADPSIAVERYRPFWLLPGRLEVHERSSAGLAALGGFLGSLFGGPGAEDERVWEVTFAIPAFVLPLDRARELGNRYTTELPRLGERLGERLTGGTLSSDDAAVLAEYVFVAREVAASGILKELRYTLDWGEPRLLGVPFGRRGDGWVDAFFGLPG